MSVNKTIAFEQFKSSIGSQKKQKDSLRGLGLRGIGSTSVLVDTPSVRGMFEKVKHLVKIVEA